MNKEVRLKVKALRKEVFEKTMEELKILKSETDSIFQELLESHENFEEVLKKEKSISKKIISKKDRTDDSYLPYHIQFVANKLYYGKSGYKNQQDKIIELIDLLETTYIE